MGFREELIRLRTSTGASYAQIDRKMERTNYISRVERGELPVPDRRTTLQLGDALRDFGARTSGEELWLLAAPEVTIDPDVRAYYEAQIESLRHLVEGDRLTGSLAELIETLRKMQVRLKEISARARKAGRKPGTSTLLAENMDIPGALNRILRAVDDIARWRAISGLVSETGEREDAIIVGLLEDLFIIPARLPDEIRKRVLDIWARVTRTSQDAIASVHQAMSEARRKQAVGVLDERSDHEGDE